MSASEPPVVPPLPGESSPGSGTGSPEPIVVLFLNLFGLGAAGYWLLGQRGKAIVALIVFLALGVKTCFAASLPFALLTAVDGYLQARQRADGRRIGLWTFFDRHL